jgi:hypothetical protein
MLLGNAHSNFHPSQWMEEKQPDLKRITAMSGDPNFDTIFKKPGNILDAKRHLKKAVNSLTTEISDPDHVPAQDMFDLYLQGVHWLLVFDKAIIVTRDIWAKHCFKDKQWGRYLDALKDLSDDINMLHIDSLKSRTTLLKTIQNILGNDSAMSRRASAIKDSDNSIKDEWAPLTLGWMDASKVKEDLKLENVTVTYRESLVNCNKLELTLDLGHMTQLLWKVPFSVRVLQITGESWQTRLSILI